MRAAAGFGASLLVAPIHIPDGRHRVHLPAGEWTGWWTRERTPGGRWIDVEHPLQTIPLWVREGAVIPLGSVLDHCGQRADTAVELLVATGPGDVGTCVGVPADDASVPVVCTAALDGRVL